MTVRALVAYSASSTHVQTTLDYLNAFKTYSGFETDYLHITHDARIDFDFDDYDVVFHNYCARLCFDGYVAASYREKMRQFRGVKILAVQDEYDHTNKLKAAIKNLGFDIVLTCVPQESLEYVYPRAEFPDVTFITVFTGYVSDDFAEKHPAPPPLAERRIKIGYRGRDIGGKYGRLGFDKFEIGRRMKEICEERGVAHDIAMDENSRIYGMAWFDFLGSCRSMLGSESGSNVFDFDGAIEQKLKQMTEANGGVQPSYEQFLPVVAQRDSEISMGQISPRVFECALMRTPMVLFRGHYSGAIKPDEHYIALEKDFSNVDEVLARIEDLPALEAMTQRAYDHLVGSGQFNYRTFFGMVGKAATDCLRTKKGARRPVPGSVPAPAAGESSFSLMDMKAAELPSTTPDSMSSLRCRLMLPLLANLGPEIERLEGEFAKQVSRNRKDVDHLCDLNGSAIDRLVARFPGAPVAKDIEQARRPSEAWIDRLAKMDVEDSEWHAHWHEARGALNKANGHAVSRTSYPVLLKVEQSIIERYRSLGSRFQDFDALYLEEIGRLSTAQKQLSLSDVQLALANIRAGRNVLRMLAFLIHAGLAYVLRMAARVARSILHRLTALSGRVLRRARWAFFHARRIIGATFRR